MSKFTNLGLVEYVKAIQAKENNTVYILSGIGRPLTSAKINERIKMGDASAIKKEAFLRTQIGKYSYDCVGLLKSYGWTEGIPFGTVAYKANGFKDQNVLMMWGDAKERGTVQNENHPDIPGLLVMTDDLGHVGVYIGMENGKRAYIEATVTGNAWRVIKSYGYKGKKHTWARWAKYAPIAYVEAPKPAPKPENKPNTNNFKKGDPVKINKGAYYQGAANGTPVSKFALNHDSLFIKDISGGNALLTPISSWVALSDLTLKGGAPVAPTFTAYKANIKKGTLLRDARGVAYKVPNNFDRVITILEESNGRGLLREPWLKGVTEAWVNLKDITKVGAPAPSKPTTPAKPKDPVVGSLVKVNGVARAGSAANSKLGKAKQNKTPGKVSIIQKGAKYPYHVVKTNGANIGWFERKDIEF